MKIGCSGHICAKFGNASSAGAKLIFSIAKLSFSYFHQYKIPMPTKS